MKYKDERYNGYTIQIADTYNGTFGEAKIVTIKNPEGKIVKKSIVPGVLTKQDILKNYKKKIDGGEL